MQTELFNKERSDPNKRSNLVKAIVYLLQHLPRERWITYVGIMNGRHDSVKAIIERSMKEAGIHHMSLDDIRVNVPIQELTLEQIRGVVGEITEPAPDDDKLEIYCEIVNRSIQNDDGGSFDDLTAIKQAVDKRLPIEDKQTKDAIRDEFANLS